MKRIFILLFVLSPALYGYSQSVEELNKAAREKAYKNDFQGAIDEFTKAIKLTSKDASIYFDRGVLKGFLKDFKGEIADYTMALEFDTTNSD